MRKTRWCNASGRTIEQRLADNRADGVDAELMFPNRGLMCWAYARPGVRRRDAGRQWNRWTHGFCGLRTCKATSWACMPAALIAPGDLAGAMEEIAWAIDQRLPRRLPQQLGDLRPGKKFGELEYNNPAFEPMWCMLVREAGLGGSPSTSPPAAIRAPWAALGGAIINYACHSMETTPLSRWCR